MTTFNEWIYTYLENDLVLFPDSIAGIAQVYKESPVNKAMIGRWDDTMQGYPPVLLEALKLHLNTVALEWLRANMPKHFIIRYLEEITTPNEE